MAETPAEAFITRPAVHTAFYALQAAHADAQQRYTALDIPYPTESRQATPSENALHRAADRTDAANALANSAAFAESLPLGMLAALRDAVGLLEADVSATYSQLTRDPGRVTTPPQIETAGAPLAVCNNAVDVLRRIPGD